MKLSALQQSYTNWRSNSFRGSATLDSSVDGSIKSPVAIFWLVLHGLCCLISLVLGFRFSHLVFFLFVSTSSTNLYTLSFRSIAELDGGPLNLHSQATQARVKFELNRMTTAVMASSSSCVVVGRHGIQTHWPHPNPIEVMKAHQIIDMIQREHRGQFGVKNLRTVIVVTPTYVQTFQALYMTGLMHSLMLVPYNVVWIMVEARGVTNETASILAKSGLRTIHIVFDQRMPNS